jgi:hypothetical protein
MSLDYAFVVVGAKAPDRLVIRVRRGEVADDLLTTQAAELLVTSDGSTRVWTADVVLLAEDVVELVHVFADDGSDVPEPGVLRVAPVIYTAAGRRRARGRLLPAFAEP